MNLIAFIPKKNLLMCKLYGILDFVSFHLICYSMQMSEQFSEMSLHLARQNIRSGATVIIHVCMYVCLCVQRIKFIWQKKRFPYHLLYFVCNAHISMCIQSRLYFYSFLLWANRFFFRLPLLLLLSDCIRISFCWSISVLKM